MRVLQVNAVYGVGSTGVIISDIHELSKNNGIESYVAYSTSIHAKDDIPNGYHIGTAFEKKIHAALCRINGKQGYFSVFATKSLLRYMDQIKPDIVNLHNLHSNYIHLNMLLHYLAENKIATVITLHDCWFYTGGCFHYTANSCFKWLQECGQCPKKLLDTPAYFQDCSEQILRDRKEYLSAIQNLTVVGVSEWITKEAEKTFLKNNELMTIYNGLEFSFFKPVESDFRVQHHLEDKFLVLGMANKWLSKVNNEVFNTFVNGIDNDSILVIVGCNEEHKRKLPANVLALPYITDRNQLRDIYSSCDVFVNCTREESLSLVNIESQACGTPVITFANTGVSETVDGESGKRVETGNAAALLEEVLKMKSKGLKGYSIKCREFVKNKFDPIGNYQKYISLYKKIGY